MCRVSQSAAHRTNHTPIVYHITTTLRSHITVLHYYYYHTSHIMHHITVPTSHSPIISHITLSIIIRIILRILLAGGARAAWSPRVRVRAAHRVLLLPGVCVHRNRLLLCVFRRYHGVLCCLCLCLLLFTQLLLAQLFVSTSSCAHVSRVCRAPRLAVVDQEARVAPLCPHNA